jgi:hypothetical protein
MSGIRACAVCAGQTERGAFPQKKSKNHTTKSSSLFIIHHHNLLASCCSFKKTDAVAVAVLHIRLKFLDIHYLNKL